MFLFCRDMGIDPRHATRFFLMMGWKEQPVQEGYLRKFKLGFSVSFSPWPQPYKRRMVKVPHWARRWFNNMAYDIPVSWYWPCYFTNLSAYARKGEMSNGVYSA